MAKDDRNAHILERAERDRERRHLRIDELPGNLNEALDELEKSALMRDALGEHIFDHFVAAKRRNGTVTSVTCRRGRSTAT